MNEKGIWERAILFLESLFPKKRESRLIRLMNESHENQRVRAAEELCKIYISTGRLNELFQFYEIESTRTRESLSKFIVLHHLEKNDKDGLLNLIEEFGETPLDFLFDFLTSVEGEKESLAFEIFNDAIHSKDADVRESAAFHIGVAADKGKDVSSFIPRLVELLDTTIDGYHSDAVYALSEAVKKGFDISDAVPALINSMDFNSRNVWVYHVDALSEAAKQGFIRTEHLSLLRKRMRENSIKKPRCPETRYKLDVLIHLYKSFVSALATP